MDVHEEYTKATTLTLPEMRRRSNGGVVCSYKKNSCDCKQGALKCSDECKVISICTHYNDNKYSYIIHNFWYLKIVVMKCHIIIFCRAPHHLRTWVNLCCRTWGWMNKKYGGIKNKEEQMNVFVFKLWLLCQFLHVLSYHECFFLLCF